MLDMVTFSLFQYVFNSANVLNSNANLLYLDWLWKLLLVLNHFCMKKKHTKRFIMYESMNK